MSLDSDTSEALGTTFYGNQGLTFEEGLTFDRLQLTEVVLVGLESLSGQASDSLQIPGHFRRTSTAGALTRAERHVSVGT